MGYAHNSPYRNAPYLDIKTPEGLITMEDTPIDLLGVDNLGNIKKMKANSKNPYKFEGDMVREIPMKKGGYTEAQYNTIRGLVDAHNHGDFDNISPNKARRILHDKKLFGKPLTPEQYRLFGYLSKGNTLKFEQGGNNPYQQGGVSQQLLSYLFDDEGEEDTVPAPEPVREEEELTLDKNLKLIRQQEQDDIALDEATSSMYDNPYRNRIDMDFDDTEIPDYNTSTYSGQLSEFARRAGFDITSTSGGMHNPGSAHYEGRAVDVRTKNKTPEQVSSFIQQALSQGYKVLDERHKPKNQRVWSGPHIHLER